MEEIDCGCRRKIEFFLTHNTSVWKSLPFMVERSRSLDVEKSPTELTGATEDVRRKGGGEKTDASTAPLKHIVTPGSAAFLRSSFSTPAQRVSDPIQPVARNPSLHSARRSVSWPDTVGGDMCMVREFTPSEPSDDGEQELFDEPKKGCCVVS